MEINSNIISNLKEVVVKEEKRFKDKQSNNRLTSANNFYNELVEKGVLKRRGYTLRGIEDTHLLNVKLNGY